MAGLVLSAVTDIKPPLRLCGIQSHPAKVTWPLSIGTTPCENRSKQVDDDDHENAREQKACYRSQVAPSENADAREQEFDPFACAFENARGIVLAITHANF